MNATFALDNTLTSVGLDGSEAFDRRLRASAFSAAGNFKVPEWEEWEWQYLYWPIIVHCGIIVISIPMRFLYSIAYEHESGVFKAFIQDFIGTADDKHVRRPALMILMLLTQLVLSMFTVVLYVNGTYSFNLSEQQDSLEVKRSFFFILHYLVLRLQKGWTPQSTFTPSAIVDIFTVVPVLMPLDKNGKAIDQSKRWLSLAFLRSYRALKAFERIEQTVDLEVSAFTRGCILVFLKSFALIICMGGVIYTLEVMGPYPGHDETFITTNMGDLNFVQMFYWIVTVISTVGFGDFSPTFAASRLVIVVFIFAGVIFFGNQVNIISEIQEGEKAGKGSYSPLITTTEHVVAVGSGVNKNSTFMRGFLSKLLDVEDNLKPPCIVLLSDLPFEDNLVDFVKTELPIEVRGNVTFLVGSALAYKDLKRTCLQDCIMAFVLPDLSTDDSRTEDHQNIIRAVTMKNIVWNHFKKHLKVRLMLLNPDSKTHAVKNGVKQERCFAIGTLKAKILAQSCRVKGFATLMAGLLEATDTEMPSNSEQWMTEYGEGVKWTIYGFVISKTFVGTPFNQAIAEIYRQSVKRGDPVLPVACQANSRVVLGYKGKLVADQVVLAIAKNSDHLKPFADPNLEWRATFVTQRSKLSCDTKRSMYEMQSVKRHLTNGVQEIGLIPKGTGSAKDVLQFRASPLLIVLIIIGKDPPWQQVVAFIKSLRQPYLPRRQPIVILSCVAAPAAVIRPFEADDVCFLEGNCLHPDNLKEAGVQDAQSVAVLACDREAAGDSAVVVLSGLIQDLMTQSKKEQFSIFELDNSESANLVRSSTACPDAKAGALVHSDISNNFPAHDEDAHGVSGAVKRKRNGALEAAEIWAQGITRHAKKLFVAPDDLFEEKSMLAWEPSYASGQVFTSEFFASMVAYMFHFPATIEFLESLTASGNADHGHNSYIWQAQCPPEWVTKDFFELQCAWISSTDKELQCDCTIILAIYRPTEGSSVCAGYNMTFPRKDLSMKAGDWLTVLGPAEFGTIMAKRQLLRGAERSDAKTQEISISADTGPIEEMANGMMKMYNTLSEAGEGFATSPTSERHRPAPVAAPPTALPQRNRGKVESPKPVSGTSSLPASNSVAPSDPVAASKSAVPEIS